MIYGFVNQGDLMINIDLICVGSLKLSVFKEVEKHILKNIKNRYKINIIEVEDEKNINIDRESEIEKVKESEGRKIISKIKKGSYVITFEINAKNTKNFSLKSIVDNLQVQNISLIIGGSVGLSKKVSQLSNLKLSISNMTFPHQLMRLIVLEQFSL